MIKTESFSKLRILDFFDLTKPRLVPLVLLSTAVGFLLASNGKIQYGIFFLTLAGTWFSASGAMTLNQWYEQDRDSQMQRTLNRPLPAGRLTPKSAFIFGVVLTLIGFGVLYFGVSPFACAISVLTSFSYLFLYTPMKPVSSLCTLIGAIPGALPPMIGCVAVQGYISPLACSLFLIIFFWQMPHFLAISWLYRQDFDRAGFKLLATQDPEGKRVARHMMYYSLALLPASLLPTLIEATGYIYFAGAFLMSFALIVLSGACFRNMERSPRILFRATIFYLAALFLLMVLDARH